MKELDSNSTDSSNNGKGSIGEASGRDGESDDSDFEPGPYIRQAISQKIGPQVEKTIDDMLYLKLRSKLIKIMPRHWVKRIVDIVTFQVVHTRPTSRSKRVAYPYVQIFQSAIKFDAKKCCQISAQIAFHCHSLDDGLIKGAQTPSSVKDKYSALYFRFRHLFLELKCCFQLTNSN